MPDLNLKDIRKEIRWPELRLPEMSRDDIAKALGDARKEIREVRKELADFRHDFEMPRVDVTSIELPQVDVGKVADGAKQGAKQVADSARGNAKQVADSARGNAKQVAKEARKAAESAGLVKPSRMRRVPFILAGLVTLGLVTWAFANSPSVKTRLREGAQRARERMAERRSAWDLDDETRAFDAAPNAGVTPSPFSDSIESANSPFAEPPSPLPEGLGTDSSTEQDMPARA
jgi:cell division septum initiation protein DivIVA